jgi:hypothetical protein
MIGANAQLARRVGTMEMRSVAYATVLAGCFSAESNPSSVDSPESMWWHPAAVIQEYEKQPHASYNYERNNHKDKEDREKDTDYEDEHSSLLFWTEGPLKHHYIPLECGKAG